MLHEWTLLGRGGAGGHPVRDFEVGLFRARRAGGADHGAGHRRRSRRRRSRCRSSSCRIGSASRRSAAKSTSATSRSWLPAALIGVALAWGLAARVRRGCRAAGRRCSFRSASSSSRSSRDRILAGQAARADIAPGLFWGAVSGFTSFVSHAGGPPFLVYTMPQKLDAKVFAGTSVLFFAAVNLMKIPPYLLLGQFTRENLTASLSLLPLAIVSTLAGVWVVRRIPADVSTIRAGVTFGLGVKLVYDAVRALMG